ncbi:hypothetical protein AV530_011509 [Patagioenas fasciata monilis]|uniref:Uncharacterized protein n=1 Tax=Patagioenas fasciata monilis TaxID=372326 RepID=A0A1V4J8K8_PATFA|nr:hypothetical protein AV530_011509 [Patagioenas fasciata monilis]
MEVHSGVDLYPHPLKEHTPEQKDVLEGGCDPVESSHWSRLLVGPVTPWKEKPTLAYLAGLMTLWGCTLDQSIPEGSPLMLGLLMENCSPWEGLRYDKKTEMLSFIFSSWTTGRGKERVLVLSETEKDNGSDIVAKTVHPAQEMGHSKEQEMGHSG